MLIPLMLIPRSFTYPYTRSAVLLLTLGVVWPLLPVHAGHMQVAPSSTAEAGTASAAGLTFSLPEKSLADYQARLLELAIRTASAMPLDPHIKNRSRAQEAVVSACLELGQPQRARSYSDEIEDWRRGACYADLASYVVRNGDVAQTEPLLQAARVIADSITEETGQSWRRDRIRAKIANAYYALGQPDAAAEFEVGLLSSEAVEIAIARAKLVDADEFDARLRALDPLIATGDFDQLRAALETCAQFFDQFYADEGRRSQAESKLKSSWTKLPRGVCIDLMLELADSALNHADRTKALQLAGDARALLDEANWDAEHLLPVAAKLALVRHRAGDEENAKRDVEAAFELFQAQRDNIVNIYRAGVLRTLAETMHSMDDGARALQLYKLAVQEGVANPNSRPRAEDLSATCCSMALHRVEPDAQLWKRLEQIHAELGSPW